MATNTKVSFIDRQAFAFVLYDGKVVGYIGIGGFHFYVNSRYLSEYLTAEDNALIEAKKAEILSEAPQLF